MWENTLPGWKRRSYTKATLVPLDYLLSGRQTNTTYISHKYCIHTTQILHTHLTNTKNILETLHNLYQSGKHLSLVTNRMKAFRLEFCPEKVLLIPQWVLFDLLPDMRMIWTGKLPLTPSIALTVHQITGWHLSKCNNWISKKLKKC